MKLEKLRLKNFGKFEDFEIVFNDGITNLVGINGSGKTTVGLTALWAGFRGIAEKGTTGALPGQRFRFITTGKKSLDVEITLNDEQTGQKLLLKRHITKSTNTIKIEPLYTDKPGMSREDVESLFNVAFLSANHFSALTGKEQAAAMGMDTTEFDKDLKSKKEDAAGYRRDIKTIGGLAPVEECTKKDINVLYDNQKRATEHNTEQAKAVGVLSTWEDKIEQLDSDIDEAIEAFTKVETAHEELLANLNELRIEASTTVKEFPAINDPIDLEPIEVEIKSIVESNHKFFLYETYQTKLAELTELNEYLDKNLELQKDIQDERSKYLQSKSFGIKGLQVDEDGNLTKDGKLIRGPYFSKGELEVLVARIGMNLNPELKVRFIDNFELLDDDNQEKLIKHLTKKGFQIITATVGKKITDNNSVLLRECKVAGDRVIEGAENVTTHPEPDVDSWDEPTPVEDERQETFDGTTKPPAPAKEEAANYDDDEF
jgi:DNA repair exonuclease SbcCD ATPase subunit